MKKNISLCMIVLNEEQFIEAAFKNAQNYVDEIIVVDGGSKDRTVEIAKKYGAKVFIKKWNEHYANQRNFGLRRATGDWILVMDADEVFEPKLLKLLQKLAANNLGIDMYAFSRKNYLDGRQTTSYPDRQYRFFKNKAGIKFVGRIHEKPRVQKFEAYPKFVHIIHKKSSQRQARQSAYYKQLANRYNLTEAKKFYAKQSKPGLPYLKS